MTRLQVKFRCMATWRMVQNYSGSKEWMSFVTHPQHHFLKWIMCDALEEHGRMHMGSIGGRNITNLEFANDIDAVAEEEQELEGLVESLDKTCTRYKMEINTEKTRLMTHSANGILREIKVKRQDLGTYKLQVPQRSCLR